MTNPDTLRLLIEDATKKRDEHAKTLLQFKREHDVTQQQINDLENYKYDYTQGLQGKLQEGLSSRDCRNHQQFITNLDRALAEQHALINQLRTELANCRAKWLQTDQRIRSLTTLSDRYQSTEQLRQTRREQKLMDEYGARAASRRTHAFGG